MEGIEEHVADERARAWLLGDAKRIAQICSEHDFGGLPKPELEFPMRKVIKLGICAVEKKTGSKPMKEFLKWLEAQGMFEVIVFTNRMIHECPIEEWPRCHVLLAFFSTGFPLAKAEAYASKYRPFLINRLFTQHLLMDRRVVYKILEQHGVPVPEHVIMNRTDTSASLLPNSIFPPSTMEEEDDYIVVNGTRIDKPFVEKPADSEDHNVYIYYPRHAGGGSKRLFRKIGDRSSDFYPDVDRVRRDGSFIYEKFLATEGTDVKVYCVTPKYAHAEGRKSPVVDGKVLRDKNGREMRYSIMLKNREKELARKVCIAFGQTICGFDMLRSGGKSYVCDVNGFSFVKNNQKYYNDASNLLALYITRAIGLDQIPLSLSDRTRTTTVPNTNVQSDLMKKGSAAELLFKKEVRSGQHEELMCVIGVVRHGDRTPKQKLKMTVTNERFLGLFEKYGEQEGAEVGDLKLKSAVQLGDVLRATREIIDMYQDQTGFDVDDSDSADAEDYDKLLQVKTVLEMHGQFKGINRKVQLKPTKRHRVRGATIVQEAQLILKWGGVLTASGRQQAEEMGRSFRQRMYPGVDGLLRLHSTYRHDLKIYSSDEGRVQVTAAAFAKGLLDLDGHLTPILASLVRKDNSLLDDSSGAKEELERTKKDLHWYLSQNATVSAALIEAINPSHMKSIEAALCSLQNKNPVEGMEQLHKHIKAFVIQLQLLVKRHKSRFGIALKQIKEVVSEVESIESSEGGSAAASLGFSRGVSSVSDRERDRDSDKEPLEQDHGDGAVTSTDMLQLGLARWRKLMRDLYHKKKKAFDLSKIPDIYDCAKYDALHSPQLLEMAEQNLKHIFLISKALADIIVPQEYGTTAKSKVSIGANIAYALLRKIRADIQSAINHLDDEDDTVHRLDPISASDMGIKSGDRHVRTRLYFTSESHLHSVMNVLRLTSQVMPGMEDHVNPAAFDALSAMDELDYQTHIVIRVFEMKRKGNLRGEEQAQGSMKRAFKVSASVSSGVNLGLKNKFGQEEDGANTIEDTQIGDYEVDLQNAPSARLNPCFPLIPLFSSLDVDRFNEIIDNALELVHTYVTSPAEKSAGDPRTASQNHDSDATGNPSGQAWPPVH